MGRLAVVAALLIFNLELRAGISSEIATQPAALRMFFFLLQEANYGYGNIERAAFIVRGPRGELGCVLWPRSEEPHMARWEGEIPAGTIAIVHTHPNRFPQPSKTDLRTAQTSGVPVYIVTRRQIRKAGPDGAALVRSDWDGGVNPLVPPCRTPHFAARRRRNPESRPSTSNATVVAASQTMPAETPPAMSESQ